MTFVAHAPYHSPITLEVRVIIRLNFSVRVTRKREARHALAKLLQSLAQNIEISSECSFFDGRTAIMIVDGKLSIERPIDH
jgi:hypothetical protein